jgi:hypothetical protein
MMVAMMRPQQFPDAFKLRITRRRCQALRAFAAQTRLP